VFVALAGSATVSPSGSVSPKVTFVALISLGLLIVTVSVVVPPAGITSGEKAFEACSGTGPEEEGVAAGITRTCPTESWVASVRPLAARSASTDTPNCVAILNAVSPAWTT
jgi:hypothetical protein